MNFVFGRNSVAKHTTSLSEDRVSRTSISSIHQPIPNDETKNSQDIHISIPTMGPLGLDLSARFNEKNQDMIGAIVKGFRLLPSGLPGYLEMDGQVRKGDILFSMSNENVEFMPFSDIIKFAQELQLDSSAWPLKLVFTRINEEKMKFKRPRPSFFRSPKLNPAQDADFQGKLNYFRGFFANKIPTGNKAPQGSVATMPSDDTVNEMFINILQKRGVPDDVLCELVRVETVERKWNIVMAAKRNEDEDQPSQSASASRIAENLVTLKWDAKGVKELEALLDLLATGTSEWAECFLDSFGLDYLMMKFPDPSPFAIEHKSEKAPHICQTLIHILMYLTHFPNGIECIISIPGLLQRATLSFHTEDVELKKITLQFLGIVCYYSSAGHKAVLDSFGYYKEAKGEILRFTALRDALKSTRYATSFKEEVLSFVNILVNKGLDLEDRVAIRSDFMHLGISEYFEEIRSKSAAVQQQVIERKVGTERCEDPSSETFSQAAAQLDNLEKQIEVFVAFMEDDRKGTIYDDTDLSDFACVFASLNNRCADEEVRDCLGSILQQLLFIPVDLKIGKEMWQLCEKTVRQIANLCPIEEVENYQISFEDRKAVLRIRDKFTEFLQHTSDTDPSFVYKIGPIELMPNKGRAGSYQVDDVALVERTNSSDKRNGHVQESRIGHSSPIRDKKVALGKVKDHPQFSKYFKLLNMGMPMEQVKLKASREGVDSTVLETPEADFCPQEVNKSEPSNLSPLPLPSPSSSSSPSEDDSTEVLIRDHPSYIKYFKLLKMGMPKEHVKQKMTVDGLLPELLDTPTNVYQESMKSNSNGLGLSNGFKMSNQVNSQDGRVIGQSEPSNPSSNDNDIPSRLVTTVRDRTLVKDHPQYAKYFKLIKMGMPTEHVKLKMSSENVVPDLLDTPDAVIEESKDSKALDSKSEGIVAEETTSSTTTTRPKISLPESSSSLMASLSLKTASLSPSPSSSSKSGSLSKSQSSSSKAKPNQNVEPETSTLSTKSNPMAVDSTTETETEIEGEVCPAKDHPSFQKFFKLKQMGMSIDHVKLKMQGEGLDASILDLPDTPIPIGAPISSISSIATVSKACVKFKEKEKKMRNLYWETIKVDDVGGTIWENLQSSSGGSLDEVVKGLLDLELLEQQFSSAPPKPKPQVKEVKPSEKRAVSRITLIDMKRAYNIGIMLARIRMPYSEIRQAVLGINKEILSIDRLHQLIQFAPEPDEIDVLKSYQGDKKILGDSEQFFLEIMEIPRFKTRLKAVLESSQFGANVDEQRRLMMAVVNCSKELEKCDRFKEILRIVLVLGNFLNDGTARGGAEGFKLSILVKLSQVKSTDGNSTLMNYLAKVIRTQNSSLLSFHEDIPSLNSACKVTNQTLKAGYLAVEKASNLMQSELEKYCNLTNLDSEDRFIDYIRPHAEHATKVSLEIQQEMENLLELFHNTVQVYGEDFSNPGHGPDVFFSIVNSFSSMLLAADRENERQRIQEERKKRREAAAKERVALLNKKKSVVNSESVTLDTLRDGDVTDIVNMIKNKRVEEKLERLQLEDNRSNSETTSRIQSGMQSNRQRSSIERKSPRVRSSNREKVSPIKQTGENRSINLLEDIGFC